jgi:hypothetical protein
MRRGACPVRSDGVTVGRASGKLTSLGLLLQRVPILTFFICQECTVQRQQRPSTGEVDA